MAEWLKAHAWKVCIRAIVSWVRIPLSPPSFLYPILFLSIHFLIMSFGMATNSGFISMLVGGIGSLAFDPVIMLISLISGSVYKDFKKSVICIFSTAFIVCILSNIL